MRNVDEATLTSMATVILAKNEERTIGEAVSGARGFGDRVVVMDGHSTDATLE